LVGIHLGRKAAAPITPCSLIGVLQSSILGVDVLAGVTVLFGVGSMSPHHGCQG
jgi:fructose-specific phosphotransferase system IIC component